MLFAVCIGLFIVHLVFVTHNQNLMANAGVKHMQP